MSKISATTSMCTDASFVGKFPTCLFLNFMLNIMHAQLVNIFQLFQLLYVFPSLCAPLCMRTLIKQSWGKENIIDMIVLLGSSILIPLHCHCIMRFGYLVLRCPDPMYAELQDTALKNKKRENQQEMLSLK